MPDWQQIGAAIFTMGMGAIGAYKARQLQRKQQSQSAIAEAPESIQSQLAEAAGKSAPETIRAFTALALLCQDLQSQVEAGQDRQREHEKRAQERDQQQQARIAELEALVETLQAKVATLEAQLGSQEREATG